MSYTQLATDVNAKTIQAVHEAQSTALAAGFDLAGKLLEQQRAYTLGVVEAFTKAAASRKA